MEKEMKIGIDFGNSYTYVFLDWFDDGSVLHTKESFLNISSVRRSGIIEYDPTSKEYSILGVPSCIAYDKNENKFFIGAMAQQSMNKTNLLKAQARERVDMEDAEQDPLTPLKANSPVVDANGQYVIFSELITNYFETLFGIIFDNKGSQENNCDFDAIKICLGRPACPDTNYELNMRCLFEDQIFKRDNLRKWGFSDSVEFSFDMREEPVLAAIAICGDDLIGRDESVLVIDSGGGTTDFSFLGYSDDGDSDKLVAFEHDLRGSELSCNYAGNFISNKIAEIITKKINGIDLNLTEKDLYKFKKDCFSCTGESTFRRGRIDYFVYNSSRLLQDFNNPAPNEVVIASALTDYLNGIGTPLIELIRGIAANNRICEKLNHCKVAFIGASMNMKEARERLKRTIDIEFSNLGYISPSYLFNEDGRSDPVVRSTAVASGAYRTISMGDNAPEAYNSFKFVIFRNRAYSREERKTIMKTAFKATTDDNNCIMPPIRLMPEILDDGSKVYVGYAYPAFYENIKGERNRRNSFVLIYEEGMKPIGSFSIPFPMEYKDKKAIDGRTIWGYQSAFAVSANQSYMGWRIEASTYPNGRLDGNFKFEWMCGDPYPDNPVWDSRIIEKTVRYSRRKR